MEKSADAFRTISEVADDLSLPQHVLRFWETRFPQIRPLKRAGGRRYYRPADVHLLRTIRQLLYDDGYTIKGVQRLIKEQGARGLATVPRDEIAALLELDPEDGEQDLAEADVTTAAMPAEPVSAVAAGPVHVGDLAQTDLAKPDVAHGDLAQALAEIDACVRILEALHRP